MRGGTPSVPFFFGQVRISIHPPRAGWDLFFRLLPGCTFYFNPPTNADNIVEYFLFQSTHPVRGGTPAGSYSVKEKIISIHPPRAGWDFDSAVSGILEGLFQSTHPVRGGTRMGL